MKKLLFSVIAVLLIAAVYSNAQTTKDIHTMKGYLVDKMCGTTMSKKPVDRAMIMAAKHTKVCATEEACAASGYGLMMDGKWIAFDDNGNTEAASYLKKTKREDHIYIAVLGRMDNGMIKVTSIKDAKE